MKLKQAFDDVFAHVDFNRDLCQRIIRYSQHFMTRNDDHNAFFGGVTLGVYPIRFMDSDREAWFDDVIEVDEELLRVAFKKVTTINHDFNVMGDWFNFTIPYVVHRLRKENRIPASIKHEAMKHAFMVMHYRFLTSLLVRRFRYPADPEIAQAAYASLSGRFDIRRYGSWRALLEARSEELISPNSIYKRALDNFDPDPMVIRIVTDSQGRIREVVKKIYAVYLETKESGQRVRTTSATTLTTDGETILKDSRNKYSGYIRYLTEVVQSERNLIRNELLEVITSGMRTMPQPLLRETLVYLSANYGKPNQRYLERLIQETLLYTFDFLQDNRQVLKQQNNIPFLLSRLKLLITASRSSDPTVIQLRTDAEKVVKSAVKTRNQPVVASVRTGLILYLVLRALTRQYYTQ